MTTKQNQGQKHLEDNGPYNYIYKKLVKENESGANHDIIGYIAYSIYKREKIQYIESFKEDNGRDPKFEDLGSFRTLSNKKVEEYKTTAQKVLQSYAVNLGIEANKKEHGFWYGVFQSLVASLIYIAFTIFIYFAVKNGWISFPGITIQ